MLLHLNFVSFHFIFLPFFEDVPVFVKKKKNLSVLSLTVMTPRAFNFNRLSISLNREASNFHLSSHDNSSYTTPLLSFGLVLIRPCCVIKHRNAFGCFETCRVLFGQGVNTPVYDRLRLGIKLGLTWKHSHLNAGRSLWVGQGLRRTDHLCMEQSARARRRSSSSGPSEALFPLLVVQQRSQLRFLPESKRMGLKLAPKHPRFGACLVLCQPEAPLLVVPGVPHRRTHAVHFSGDC